MVRRRRGMSLVEVLVAFGLLLLASAISLEALSTTSRGLSQGQGREVAASLCSSLLDETRVADFDTLATRSGTVSVPGIRNGQDVTRSFSFTVNVRTVSTDVKGAWVHVSWDEGGQTSWVDAETLIYRH